MSNDALNFIARLEAVIAERSSADPDQSYTAQLLGGGPAKVAQKVGEEAVELTLAAVNESDERVVAEAADLVYHVLVLLRSRGLMLGDVVAELETRHAE